MPKYEFILVEVDGDSSTQRGPAIRPQTIDLQTVITREVPQAAKHEEHNGASFYMIKRLEDGADMASGPIP